MISAGTRNHFAMDLGLDRDNPAAGLDALTSDGVEQRIDLGVIGGRTFVNNASFGAYASRGPSRRSACFVCLELAPLMLRERHGAPSNGGLGRTDPPLTGIADVTANMAKGPDPALYPGHQTGTAPVKL